MSLALDRPRLAARFGTRAEPAGQILPPGFTGRDDAIAPSEHDLEAARALMAEAGVPDGFDLIIWAPNSPRPFLPDPVGTAEDVAAMLGAIGINATVRAESLRKFLDDRDSGRFSSWIIGWEAQTGDPDNLWFWHFGAGRLAAEGQYDRPDLAALLLEAQHLLASEQRAELYRSAARIVHDDVARIFLAHTHPIVAISSRLRNFVPGQLGFDELRDVSLAPGLPPAPLPTRPPDTATPEATATADAEATADPSATEGPATATTGPEPTAAPSATVGPTTSPTASARRAATPLATPTATSGRPDAAPASATTGATAGATVPAP
jgi:hypothetical protein